MQRVVYPSIFLVENVFSSWNINRIEINAGGDDIVKVKKIRSMIFRIKCNIFQNIRSKVLKGYN